MYNNDVFFSRGQSNTLYIICHTHSTCTVLIMYSKESYHLSSHEARFFSCKNQWSVYFGIYYKHFACKRMINFFCDMVVVPREVPANEAWRGFKRKLGLLEKLWLEVMKKWIPRHWIIIALRVFYIMLSKLHYMCVRVNYRASQDQYYHWNEEIEVL